MKKVRTRLDMRLVELNLAEDATKAKAMLLAGEVFVNQRRFTNAGALVSPEDCVEVHSRSLPFASRGGFKLQKALTTFGHDVSGLVVADVGASNGGFTDCLLQSGAKRVYAIDVGYGQLASKLRNDPRVIVRDRTNARFLTPDDFEEQLDLITVDASFIALARLLPTLMPLLKSDGYLLGLIKPQFEAQATDVGVGGVVRDPDIHRRVLQDLRRNALESGFVLHQLTFSPIKGPAGNIEFLGDFRHSTDAVILTEEQIEQIVQEAHCALD